MEENVDYLIIGSGSPDDNELERITGNNGNYGPIKSLESQMWVRFISDETISGMGFSINWQQDDGNTGKRIFKTFYSSVAALASKFLGGQRGQEKIGGDRGVREIFFRGAKSFFLIFSPM